jgi:hypothetical protein
MLVFDYRHIVGLDFCLQMGLARQTHRGGTGGFRWSTGQGAAIRQTEPMHDSLTESLGAIGMARARLAPVGPEGKRAPTVASPPALCTYVCR